MPNFQTFLLQNAKGNFYILSLYKKSYIILDIIVIHMICTCMCICIWYGSYIIHKNCIILNFYNSCRIKEKCVEFWFLKNFLCLVKNENTKRPGFCTVLVTGVFSNSIQPEQLNKIKNTCEYCDLLVLWFTWIGNPR